MGWNGVSSPVHGTAGAVAAHGGVYRGITESRGLVYVRLAGTNRRQLSEAYNLKVRTLERLCDTSLHVTSRPRYLSTSVANVNQQLLWPLVSHVEHVSMGSSWRYECVTK